MSQKITKLNYNKILINSHNIHYCQQGQEEGKDKILFIHGWLNYSGLWHGTMQEISPFFSCYALDLPGFGDSDDPQNDEYQTIGGFAKLVEGFCNELDITSCILVGHSMGGMTSLKVALECPDLVKKLVLVDTVVTGDLGLPLNLLNKWGERLYSWGLGLGKWFTPLFEMNTRSFYLFPNQNENYKDVLQKARQHKTVYQVKSLVSITQTDLTDQLGNVKPQTLIIFGEEDRTVPKEQAELLNQRIPKAQLEAIPQAAHMPMIEQPKRFNRILLDFLRKADMTGQIRA